MNVSVCASTMFTVCMYVHATRLGIPYTFVCSFAIVKYSIHLSCFCSIFTVFVIANGLLVILDLDDIKTFANNMTDLMKKNDKIERFKQIGKTAEGDSLGIVPKDFSAAEDKFDQAFASLQSLTLPQEESVKIQASVHSFRLALVEDSLKARPTALVFKVRSSIGAIYCTHRMCIMYVKRLYVPTYCTYVSAEHLQSILLRFLCV